jgi:hypothetical protein
LALHEIAYISKMHVPASFPFPLKRHKLPNPLEFPGNFFGFIAVWMPTLVQNFITVRQTMWSWSTSDTCRHNQL